MVFHGFWLVSMVFQVSFMVFGWFPWFFEVVSWFFMVFGWFPWFFKVVSWFFMVFGWFPWFFMVVLWFFHVFGWFHCKALYVEVIFEVTSLTPPSGSWSLEAVGGVGRQPQD